MKPAVTESALDGVLERLLLADRDVGALFLRSALPELFDLAFDRVTVARQVRHLGASGTADLVARFWAGPSCVAMLLGVGSG